MFDTCPNGHHLAPGQVLVGWSPCGCASTRTARRGHRTTQCLACSEQGETMVRYEPPHAGGGHPNRRSISRIDPEPRP